MNILSAHILIWNLQILRMSKWQVATCSVLSPSKSYIIELRRFWLSAYSDPYKDMRGQYVQITKIRYLCFDLVHSCGRHFLPWCYIYVIYIYIYIYIVFIYASISTSGAPSTSLPNATVRDILFSLKIFMWFKIHFLSIKPTISLDQRLSIW